MTTAQASSSDCYSDSEKEKENTEVEEKCEREWGAFADRADSPPEIDGRAFLDLEDNLKFFPPLYRQRYETVREILKDERWCPPPATVVEFGCAELAMFPYFKQVSHITKVFMVDIDFNLVDYYSCRTAPLTCDYLTPRENPLHVEVMCGSVADCDARMQGANAVVCIELIEHLELDIVEKLEKTIFGFIEPEIAIFTTPNSDFNVLLNGMQGKFRHWDHKFEWSRREFTDWTNKVLSQYPQYRVEISGVGLPPEGSEEVGHCSQLALFVRNSDYIPVSTKDAQEIYTTCRTYDHPTKPPDSRSDGEKLQDEVHFRLNRLGFYDCYQAEDEDFSYVPLVDLTLAVQNTIPSTDSEAIRCCLLSEDIVERDGIVYVRFNKYASKSSSDSDSDHDLTDEEDNVENYNCHVGPENNEDEEWDIGPPGRFAGPEILSEYHIAMANLENVSNLVYERHSQMRAMMGWSDPEDDDNHEEDDDNEDNNGGYYEYYAEEQPLDCEKIWNSIVPLRSSTAHEKGRGSSEEIDGLEKVTEACSPGNGGDFIHASMCGASSPIAPSDEHESLMGNTKRDLITDSGVDLSPLLNHNSSQDEMADILPTIGESKVGIALKTKDLPKSTSVEVLHLDGSCTLKRRAGLEYLEFAPSTSVALCYTGQTYSGSDKVLTNVNMSMSSERKSLDGSLVRDVADSYSFDFAGDSGYPNSSSLHHDVDVDLTPEQVDDISSENDDRSNPSLSEDELSDSLDRAPALPRRVIHPRHPVVPIVFENVENGDLANNNRDGEGNNAVAPLGDEREFVALVQEGDMQPLLAAPAVDVILPYNADPFPHWLMDLLNIEDADEVPAAKVDDLEHDEGLGEDSI